MKEIIDILKNKSIRYILFRLSYEFERRTGLLAIKFPVHPKEIELPTLTQWKASGVSFLFKGRRTIEVGTKKNTSLLDATQFITEGKVLFFSHEWKPLGLNWDYVTNPITGFHYDIKQHWTKVDDYSEIAGDIKFVWEPSRFSFIYTIVRNDYHNDEDHAEFVISRILDWIDKNPLNCGPNYKCSQEISIRVLNWLFALYFYRDSVAITDSRWHKIMQSIYWQVDHVYKNINFSRISVRNNHAITESLTLYLVGLLFPEIPNASRWKKNGKRWFEQEIEYQFEPDGSYIQQSMNYQRVVTQLLTLGISLAEKNGERFKDVIYQRAYANLNFLYQMQDEQSGWLPNYGANDGALLFVLNDLDYRDYRPQIDALHQLLTGETLYDEQLEDAKWYGVTIGTKRRFNPLKYKQGMTVFKEGGYFIVRDKDKMLFIRCGNFKGTVTPDQMHIDVWYNGDNLLMDGGSYMYNTDEELRIYFAGTESSNTVMLDDHGQMKKGPRFMWFCPSKIKGAKLVESENGFFFEGVIETFRELGEGIVWYRTISINKNLSELEVSDEVKNKPVGMKMRQIWHTISNTITLSSDGEREERIGWYSDYYGTKNKNCQLEFSSLEGMVITQIKLTQ